MNRRLISEACAAISAAKTDLERKQLVHYYIGIAHGVGFDSGIQHNVRHSMKPVECWDDKGIQNFDSVRDAARKMKINHANILRAITTKKKCNGFRWAYQKIK